MRVKLSGKGPPAIYADGMESADTQGKRLWKWFITPPSSATLWRRTAWSLWLTSAIMFSPLLLPILEPSSIPQLLAEHWDIYLLFFGVPFALGTYCWRRSNRTSAGL